MDNNLDINKILRINNAIINTKNNNPNDYFFLKSLKNKLYKQISETLDTNYNKNVDNYISGPSIPSTLSINVSED
jgi:hypothetical protein